MKSTLIGIIAFNINFFMAFAVEKRDTNIKDYLSGISDAEYRRMDLRMQREAARSHSRGGQRFECDGCSKRQFPVWAASVAQVINFGSRKNAGICT